MGMSTSGSCPSVGRAADLIADALAAGRSTLSEPEAKALLHEYGVAVPEAHMVGSADEAGKAGEALGYPVVLKGVSAVVLHKTEAGLVELDVRDAEAAAAAYRRIVKRGAGRLTGVLVERQLPRDREFAVGLTHDHQFGPVVMFGVGGVLTEALNDVAFAVAPVSHAEALELLLSIRAARLLSEFRGWPAADLDALARVVEAVSQLGLDHPQVAEVDVNPLLLDGGRPVAADALVVLQAKAPAAPTRLAFSAANMAAVYRPRSIAVVGASNDPTKWGGTILVNLLSGGYAGALYPVTPQGESVLGLRAYPSVTSLPEVPDMALVAVPVKAVKGVVEECGRKGVKALVMITAGFSEVGEEGAALEREVAELAASYDMVLIGPNCMGVVSARTRMYAVGAVLLHPEPGPAAFVSQSGNVGVQLMASAERRGGGIGSFLGVGNEALVHTADVLDFLREDPETGSVFAYMEGCDDGRRLLESARNLTRQKPLVILRAAVSEYGKRAAASHTGALAGSQRVFAGAARQAGMLVTIDPEEFLDLAMAFSYLPLPRGPRVGVVTMGGGWGVLSADEVARSGLSLAEFDESLLRSLSSLLPPFWSRGNPVDLVATVREGVAEAVVEAIAASSGVDALVVCGVESIFELTQDILTEAEHLREAGVISLPEAGAIDPEVFARRRRHFVRHLVDVMERYEKPIMSVSAIPVTRSVFCGWSRYGVVVSESPLRAVRVLAKMVAFVERRQRVADAAAAGQT